jgi:hypothetical protein
MAGVKVTDLPALGTAASDDIMYIVDTSTNTSKQIEVQDIYDGLPQFASGQFTPTISNVNPVATIANPQLGYYHRVGNIVSMSFFFELSFDVLDNQVTFDFDLPIASTFTSSKDIIGTITSDDTTLIDILYLQATGNIGTVTCNTNTAGSSIQYIRAIFQYEIK